MQKIKEFLIQNERHIGPVSIVAGFIFDSLTLGRPDQLYGNIIFLTYFFITALGIIALSVYERRGAVVPVIILFFVQFSFGNLAGGLVVFYAQSGSFQGSLLFFLILAAFIVGNELIRNYYDRLAFHASVWFFLLFLYTALVVPIIIKRIDTLAFLLSGVASLLLVILLIYIIYRISPEKVLHAFRYTIISIVSVYAVFNGLYFLNILPPVPLSVISSGIYHTVEKKADGNFDAKFEKAHWYDFWKSTSDTFSLSLGQSAYCFASVYVPVKIDADVGQRWEFYDEKNKEWQTRSTIDFNIVGGRYNGYRIYSAKSALTEGAWRCSIETSRGALIGRVNFKVVASSKAILSSKTI